MSSLVSTPSQEPASLADRDTRPISRKWLWFWAAAITATYALLWSPHWYPLSDSSLYLSLGRSFAEGRGLTMMGDTIRLVPPLTPLFIGMLIKAGASLGAIQAAMIILTLTAHLLCFLTLRRWTNPRLALGATIGSAFSYWVFANAFTIMSEPLCIALMWGGFLVLSHVNIDSPRRWLFILLACLLLVLAAANRDAIFCFLPGPLLAVILRNRRNGRLPRESFAWAAVFFVVFGSWFFYRYPPKFLVALFTPKVKYAATTTSATQATTAPAPVVVPPPVAINPEFDDEPSANAHEGRYHPGWMSGVKHDFHHLVTETPVLAGRWISEGMVMAAVGVFQSKIEALRILGTTVAVLAFLLMIAGAIRMLSRGHWWVVGALLYFAFIWIQWGTRIKPRYMIPIAPLLFLFIWSGLTWLIVLLAAQSKDSKWNPRTIGRAVLASLVALVFIGNAFPWCVEFYIRHLSHRDFYDLARRGAYAELVDIGAYAQQHVPPGQSLLTNAGAHRRIAYFLSGRRIETTELKLRDWKDFQGLLNQNNQRVATRPVTLQPETTQPPPVLSRAKRRRMSMAKRRRRFFIDIPAHVQYLVLLIDRPRKGETWPGWHLPMKPSNDALEWWRLYQRQPNNTWKVVSVPRSRDYIRHVPPASD